MRCGTARGSSALEAAFSGEGSVARVSAAAGVSEVERRKEMAKIRCQGFLKDEDGPALQSNPAVCSSATGLGVPAHPAAAPGDLGRSGRAASHLPESPAQGWPAPGLHGGRSAQGELKVQGHILPRLWLHQGDRLPGVPGACGGAGDIYAVLRQSRVRRQRRQPEEVPEERRHGRRGARGRAAARGQVLRGWHLHGRIHCVELPQLHSAQVGRSGSGRAGGELLVAAARRRAEERVREAGRPGPDDVLDRAPRAVAVPRLAQAEVAPGVADHQGRARRVHGQGLGDPHRGLEEEARERPGVSGQSDAAGDLRVAVPRRDDPVRHVGVRSHGDQEPVPRRRGRRQHLAGVRGQDRPGGDPAPRGAEAAVGAVPRAPGGRAPAGGHGRSRRRDSQGALARRGAAGLAAAERAAPGWLSLLKGWRMKLNEKMYYSHVPEAEE